jgi:hypothetical protein
MFIPMKYKHDLRKTVFFASILAAYQVQISILETLICKVFMLDILALLHPKR